MSSMSRSCEGSFRSQRWPIATCVGLEDRDWYREESSEAYWRELNRSIGAGAHTNRGRKRASVGLLGAVGISLALTLVANHAGVLRLPLPNRGASTPSAALSRPNVPATPAKTIILGTKPGFDVPVRAGQHWCLT